MERLRAQDPNDWRVATYDAKKAKRTRTGKNRKCSYCDEKGHNRATCSYLKEHMSTTQGKNAIFRAAIYKRFQALGIGVGTIISSDRNMQRVDPDDYESERYRVPQVITQICWDNINFWNKTYTYFDKNAPYLTKPLTKIDVKYSSDADETSAAQYEDGSHWRYDDRYTFFAEVESPVTADAPPAKWFDSVGRAIKALYKKRTKWEGAL
ncbi:MAG TPA: hypothetical protein EYO59_10350 [Chromatiaceae bacterium]|nr:hypothetical protein [Chromatiaceae bacterium]